jgi:CubicO group peptidase (beta-lactamase class C family)
MAARIAAQPQSTDPRATATYHPLTFGWICGELVRRITGRSIGCFFAEEIAEPLGLDLWIGLPAQHEHRVTRVELAADWGLSSAFTPEQVHRDGLIRSVVANPPRFDRDNLPWNETLWHAAEIPGANAIGTARSIARLYASLPSLLAPETIALASRPLTAGPDTLSGRPIAFSTGFQVQRERMPFGPPPDAFGHGGAGGSRHGYWPALGVGFSYAMNLLREDATDTRATSLLHALHHTVAQAQ